MNYLAARQSILTVITENIEILQSQASPQETSASGLETETPPVSLSQNLSGDPNPLLECDTSMLFGSDEVCCCCFLCVFFSISKHSYGCFTEIRLFVSAE